ncbi:MAG: sigma-70 family RNA polymerase sigma factor [Alphaproteobacteria bacterium]|nr:sigma-70 family RNA polymerase sigma factor [Alphaproteobacteria bacterium]
MSASELADLIEPHIPALRRYAFALTREPHAADDLVQDCLERALAHWGMRRPGGSLKAWLFTILHNCFISDRRRAARRGPHLELDEAPGLPVSAARQEEGLALRDVAAALRALPEDQQAVLLLVGVEELSYEEAAKVLAVPVGTVMSRLSRGRERLRQRLEGGRPGGLRRVK